MTKKAQKTLQMLSNARCNNSVNYLTLRGQTITNLRNMLKLHAPVANNNCATREIKFWIILEMCHILGEKGQKDKSILQWERESTGR